MTDEMRKKIPPQVPIPEEIAVSQHELTPLLELITPLYNERADVADLNYNFWILDQQLGEIPKEIERLEELINNHYAEFTQLKSDFEKHEEANKQDFERVDGEIREAKGRLDSLEKDVGALQSDVGTLQTDVTNLKSRVNTLETNLNSLKTKVEGLETDLNSLKTRVSGLETNLNSLTTKVNGLESRIGTLESQVGNLQSQVTNMQLEINKINERLASFRTATQEEVEDLVGGIGKDCEDCEDCPCPPDFKDILDKAKPSGGWRPGGGGGPPAASNEEVADMMKDVLDGCDSNCELCEICECPHDKPNFGDILGSGTPGSGSGGSGSGGAIDRTQIATADEVDNMLNDAFSALNGGNNSDPDAIEVEVRKIASVNEVDDMLTDTLGKKSGD